MEQAEIKVEGMTCGGCVASVTRAISRLPGVVKADVSLEKAQASVQFDATKTDRGAIRQAVIDAGFESPTG